MQRTTRARTEANSGVSTRRAVFGAMALVGFLTLLTKLSVAGRDLILAARYGTAGDLDAFFVAWAVPLFASNVISGALNSAVLPTFVRVRDQEGSDAAERLLGRTMRFNVAATLVLCLVLAAAADPILRVLASGFPAEKLALTRRLFLILLPGLILSGMGASWAAALNANKRFAAAAIVPIFSSLLPVIVLLVAGRRIEIATLIWSALGGLVLEAVSLALALRNAGYAPLASGKGANQAAFREVLGQYGPTLAGAFLFWSTSLVDQAMAAHLGAGSVTKLSYANRIVAGMAGLGSASVSTAIFPHVSEYVARQDWASLRRTVRFYLSLILVVTAIGTALMVLFSPWLVRIFFEHGAFKHADTIAVAHIQALYCLQLPFVLSSTILVRLVSALRANHVLMWGSLVSLVIDIAANLIFMRYWGTAGIALSTSLVYALSFAYLLFMSHWLLKSR